VASAAAVFSRTTGTPRLSSSDSVSGEALSRPWRGPAEDHQFRLVDQQLSHVYT
jgi:hypothetical protein